MSTAVKALCSYASMIHVSRNDLVVTVGDIASYLDIKSL